MKNDEELELSQQLTENYHINNHTQIQTNTLLQPITTQQRFNIKNNFAPQTSESPVKQYSFKNSISTTNNEVKRNSSQKSPHISEDQSKNFLSFLNQKVSNLRKQKETTSQGQQKQKQQRKSQSTTLRKIINQQFAKQTSNEKPKRYSSIEFENRNEDKKQNPGSQQKIELDSSLKAKQEKETKKIENNKRFSNSQSDLAKKIKQINHVKANNLTDIKKSLNLQTATKSPKLPNLTPSLKMSLPPKVQSQPLPERKPNKKSTIDQVSRDIKQKQKRKTPESKNSFRIKKNTIIQQNIHNNRPRVDIRKVEEVFTKSISKQKDSPMHQGKNRRMREDFMKLNEQQRTLQAYIFKNHQQNKDLLQKILNSYKLSTNANNKYGIKKQSDFQVEVGNSSPAPNKSPNKKVTKQSHVEKSSEKEIKTNAQEFKESGIEREKRKNRFLLEELQKINNLIKTKEKQIQKQQSRIQKNPFIKFLRQLPDDIMEEPEEEEADRVEELPSQKPKSDHKNQGQEFSSTYSSVMTEIKNKKWGLKQRITFETNRQLVDRSMQKKQGKTVDTFNALLSKNSFSGIEQGTKEGQQTENEKINNKIEVNSRLRGLLLD